MRYKNTLRILCAVLALCLAACALTACGDSAAEKVTVTVIDGDAKTSVEIEVGKTVKDALDAAKITLGAQDDCTPKPEEKIAADTAQITVSRYVEPTEPAATEAPTAAEEVREEKVTEKIAYSTEEEYSDSMADGTSEVTRPGVDGEKEITYKVTYVDGKETAREKIGEKVTKEPVSEIVTYGTAPTRTVVSREPMPDCDADGHGTWIVTYDDGTQEFEYY